MVSPGCVCGADKCTKRVRVGLTCSYCVTTFHPACVGLSKQEFKRQNSAIDALWFCQVCGALPVVRCLFLLKNKCDRLTEIIERLVNTGAVPLGTNMSTLNSQRDSPGSTSETNNKIKSTKSTQVCVSPPSSTCSTPAVKHKLSVLNSTSPKNPGLMNVVTPTETTNQSQLTGHNTRGSYAAVASMRTLEESSLTPSISGGKSGVQLSERRLPVRSTESPTLRTTDVIKPKINRRDHNALTVVCLNVPESQSNTLKGKLMDDRKQWDSVCDVLGLRVEPITLRRITRPTNSEHYAEPRILRVTLNSTNDTEAVLLSSFLLHTSTLAVRIWPEIPRKKRIKLSCDGSGTQAAGGQMALIVHGVPELRTCSSADAASHDREQWAYIRETLSLNNVIAKSLQRLPVSPDYKGYGPRLLKVTLQSEHMMPIVLKQWIKFRNRLPTEVRLKEAKICSRPVNNPSGVACLGGVSALELCQETEAHVIATPDGIRRRRM